MATNVEKDVEQLRNEYAELKSDVSKLTETMKKLYGDTAEAGRARARRAAERSRERARETYGAFEEEVRERPLTTIAAAFGIGLVIGKLLDR